ncbi:hypothetical protein [Pontiella sulfatireligans]|uniref:Uncharacterized protein n=1 Tax=Pontiella sulfatireligans TaxID=2750658 RepID=A0A6C2UPL7_9BACT|nr:hypothetical protein [Pontiella sulfatireligans]VGO22148.1 hypothetical protein SCARR_04229 [Pontiella sulfatireligans]
MTTNIRMATWFVFLIGGLFAFNAEGTTAAYTFDNYVDGSICGQQGWKIILGVPSGYRVVDGAGKSGNPGDKALRIEFKGAYSKISAPETLSWKPGETSSVEFDFRLNLDAKPVPETREFLLLAMGDPRLEEDSRWVEALGTEPDGEWCWGGGAPDWQLLRNQPASTFVARPETGSADSKWFHLVFTTTKADEQGAFESVLTVTDSAGVAVLHRVYTTEPDNKPKQIKVWSLEEMTCGFVVGKESPHGTVFIDNLNISSKPRAKSYACNFDDFHEGCLAGQQNWALIRGSSVGFKVEKAPGRSEGKALKIDFETAHSTILAPAALSWDLGETWSLDFDFKLDLEAGGISETIELFTLLMGGGELADGCRWVEALGIQPDGKWSWIGGAPNWKLDKNLPASLFLDRPETGLSKSPWFHFSFSSKKSEESNRFKSILKVIKPDQSGIIIEHAYKTGRDNTKMASTVWNLKSMRFGLSQGKAPPRGSIWIDNIKAASLEAERGAVAAPSSRAEKRTEAGGYAKIYCKRPFSGFRNDDDISLDEWGGVFASIPDRFKGFKISQSRTNTEKPLQFTVKSQGTVCLVAQKSSVRTLTKDGWKISGEARMLNRETGATVPLMILEKHLDAGEYEYPSKGRIGTQILKD